MRKMLPAPWGATLLLLSAAALCGCGGEGCPRGRPVSQVEAKNPTSVTLAFACELDEGSAGDPARYAVADLTRTPAAGLAVNGASAAGQEVVLYTATQTGKATYTLTLSGIRDAAGNDLEATVNFVGAGSAGGAATTFRVDDRYAASLTAVDLLASIDPLTGSYSHIARRITLFDPDKDHVFLATLSVVVDPARTKDTADDRLGAAYMAYSVRAVDPSNRPLSKLVLFEAKSSKAQTVDVALLSVPDKPPVEGFVTATFKVDDRPARALSKPSLKGSFDSKGKFDASFPTTVALTDEDGDDIWVGTAKVWIDPLRTLTGTTSSTQPYSVVLVESGTSYSARSADFVAAKEAPVGVSILVGNKDMVPVTLRADVSGAYLDESGTQKGVYSGEAVFITGAFAKAEDAFGQNATDSFSGGENVVLQMEERTDIKGLWERTIFLPKSNKDRPYSFKVVRCPKDKGCTQLNKMVTSSGRAFPTVMKNLVTELCDASKTTWSDANCKSPRIIDPRSMTKVNTGVGGVLDYSQAKVWTGNGAGLKDQKDPAGTPNASLMFKQEVPDLVVNVKDKAVQAPAYVIGTWRDVNIPGTPADILSGGSVVELSKTDYDAGLTGKTPPSYNPPQPPKPSPFKMDGTLDTSATLVAGGSSGGGTMPLYLAISGDHLYLATDDAGEGSDNFIIISATAPTAAASRPAPWAKAGTMAFAGKVLFAADEDENNYAGWFELATFVGGSDKLLFAQGSTTSTTLDIYTPSTSGGVLEAVLDLKSLFGSVPTVIYLATAPWVSATGGALYHAAQTPKTTNGDGNVDSGEMLKVSLPSLKVQP